MSILVTRSLFRNNGNRTLSTDPLCSFLIPIGSQDSHILFEKSRFEENVAISQIVDSNINTAFKNCYFKNNVVLDQGGDVVVRWGSLTIQNTSFLNSINDSAQFSSLASTSSFISCVTIPQIIITNSSFITDNLLENYPIISLSTLKWLKTDQLTSIDLVAPPYAKPYKSLVP